MNLDAPIEPERVEPFLHKKAALQEAIDLLQNELQTAKAARNGTPKHVKLFDVGDAKNTYVTGCFMLLNTGYNPVPSSHGQDLATYFAGKMTY